MSPKLYTVSIKFNKVNVQRPNVHDIVRAYSSEYAIDCILKKYNIFTRDIDIVETREY